MERGFVPAMQSWWDADYSWSGLARKFASIDGATLGLDEIFAEFADQLVEFDGRKWSPLHVPWFTPDGCRGDEPAVKQHAMSRWLKEPVKAIRGRCLSGLVSPNGINLSRGTSGSLVADQIMLGGGLVAAGIDGLRITRSRIDGNLRARRCTFAQDVTVYDSDITGAIDFADCEFDRVLDVRDCEVGGRIELSGGQFKGYSLMVETTCAQSGLAAEDALIAGNIVLNASVFAAGVNLDRMTIDGSLRAGGATFASGVSLAGAVVGGDLDLHCAALDGPLVVEAARIGGQVRARGSPGQPLAGLSARRADLGGQADFSGRAFTQSIDCSSTRFAAPPLMHGCTMHPDVSFAGATFDDLPSRMRIGMAGGQAGWRNRLNRWLPLAWTASADQQKDYNLECERLGSAYRTLRLAAAAISNVEYEARFHVLELRMRRSRTDVPMLERATSFAYDWLAACGTSLSRPVMTIVAVPFVGTLVLFALFPGFTRLSDAPNLLRFSLRQMAPPPTVWTAGDLSMSGKPITEIAAQWPAPLLILGTLIFMITAIMLAVLIVALQRRFRQ